MDPLVLHLSMQAAIGTATPPISISKWKESLLDVLPRRSQTQEQRSNWTKVAESESDSVNWTLLPDALRQVPVLDTGVPLGWTAERWHSLSVKEQDEELCPLDFATLNRLHRVSALDPESREIKQVFVHPVTHGLHALSEERELTIRPPLKKMESSPVPSEADVEAEMPCSNEETQEDLPFSDAEMNENVRTAPSKELANLIRSMCNNYRDSCLNTAKRSNHIDMTSEQRLQLGAENFVAVHHLLQQKDPSKELVSLNELVITVAISKPRHPARIMRHVKLLGSQTLTHLRDMIYCLVDRQFKDDDDPNGSPHLHKFLKPEQVLNQAPAQAPEMSGAAIQGVGSAMFYIENVCYNDLRRSDAEDYSENIVNWLKSLPPEQQPNAGQTPIGRQSMDGIRLDEMTLRFHYPYLFVHQGHCEHIITFIDAKLFHSLEDPPHLTAYPQLVFQEKFMRHRCRICDLYPGTNITFGDRLAPENPCYFCDRCYYPFHYDAQGNLLYDDFKVFRYVHEP